eukprot:TRINITY_DN1370_c0_g1_i1.p1 TRINITY_DN1370_c0_g1~~TRINITY_DN1370_c0_g1_i1.p1  ORF type:complete len:375 (-),score=122.54 TRINITY_DN1370_c0_g1_i1:176-1300(-)
MAEETIKQGFIKKRGDFGWWKNKWATLDSHHLRIFSSNLSSVPMCTFNVSDIKIQLDPKDGTRFTLLEGSSKHLLKTQTPREKEEWVEAIQSVLPSSSLTDPSTFSSSSTSSSLSNSSAPTTESSSSPPSLSPTTTTSVASPSTPTATPPPSSSTTSTPSSNMSPRIRSISMAFRNSFAPSTATTTSSSSSGARQSSTRTNTNTRGGAPQNNNNGRRNRDVDPTAFTDYKPPQNRPKSQRDPLLQQYQAAYRARYPHAFLQKHIDDLFAPEHSLIVPQEVKGHQHQHHQYQQQQQQQQQQRYYQMAPQNNFHPSQTSSVPSASFSGISQYGFNPPRNSYRPPPVPGVYPNMQNVYPPPMTRSNTLPQAVLSTYH